MDSSYSIDTSAIPFSKVRASLFSADMVFAIDFTSQRMKYISALFEFVLLLSVYPYSVFLRAVTPTLRLQFTEGSYLISISLGTKHKSFHYISNYL